MKLPVWLGFTFVVMDPGFIIFFVLASGAVFALWVLDLYLGSKFHLSRMLKRTNDR